MKVISQFSYLNEPPVYAIKTCWYSENETVSFQDYDKIKLKMGLSAKNRSRKKKNIEQKKTIAEEKNTEK